ncbi:MAG: NUDIX domain-containing protein [Oscillospiraceae bacterium]
MIYKYCPFCGKKLIFKIIGDEGEIPYCTVCEKPLFPIFSTCVISIIINEFDEIALIKQSYGDTQKYKCVAGFMKPNETAEECVSREIQEEIGLNPLNVKYINSYFYEKCDQLMLGFCCKVKK